jgi:spore coat polysaccharide biosynthesis protein SpsF
LNFDVILAARMGSSRLPGKALLPLAGVPMIQAQLRRLLTSRLAASFALATTTLNEDDLLAEAAEAEGIRVFRGEVDDVLARYCGAATALGAEYVVRVTGDCPFVDGESLDFCLKACESLGNFDLASTHGRFPVGIDYEIVHSTTLRKLHESAAVTPQDREHLTLHLYGKPDQFRVTYIDPPAAWRWDGRPFTVDTESDYLYASRLVARFADLSFSVGDLLREARAMGPA